MTSGCLDVRICVKMAAACKLLSIPIQLLGTNIGQVLIPDLIVHASCSSGVVTQPWCVLTDPVHINQAPSCCFRACFVPEGHVSTLPLLQLKVNQLYHKVDSRIQMSKVRSGVCACVGVSCVCVCAFQCALHGFAQTSIFYEYFFEVLLGDPLVTLLHFQAHIQCHT